MTKTNARITISDKQRSVLPDEMFGQFMERATFGEPGPEAACDDQGKLRPSSYELVKQMAPPVVRFPGGTDIDYLDWHDLIDYAPGRECEQRPAVTKRKAIMDPQQKSLGTRFGLIEFLECMQDIGSEPILVLNIGESWLKENPDENISYHCAAMLAYVNAPLENNLPAALKPYPEARAKSGHPEPFAVKKWQLGNETWLLKNNYVNFFKDSDQSFPDDDSWIEIQRDRLERAIKQMKAVDPEIELIIDGGNLKQLECNVPSFRDQVDYFAFHHYKPMGGPILTDSQEQDREIPSSQLDTDELFKWMVAAPDMNQHGESAYTNDAWEYIRKHQVPIAFTEWNWNGWFKQAVAQNNWHWRGLGAAGMLHAMMREAEHIKLACQSMFIGCGWGIMSISVHPDDERPPFMHPSGLVTDLYKQHHGDVIIQCHIQNAEFYDARYTSKWHPYNPHVAYIDAIVSRNKNAYFIHVINRQREQAAQISIDGIDLAGHAATHYSIQQNQNPWQEHRHSPASTVLESTFQVNGEQTIELSAASVNVIRIDI